MASSVINSDSSVMKIVRAGVGVSTGEEEVDTGVPSDQTSLPSDRHAISRTQRIYFIGMSPPYFGNSDECHNVV
jgi:hypothetical protein